MKKLHICDIGFLAWELRSLHFNTSAKSLENVEQDFNVSYFFIFFWPLIFWLLKMNLKLWINVIYLHQTQSSLIFPWLWHIFYPLEILKFHGSAFVGPSCTFPLVPSQAGWQLVSFPATIAPGTNHKLQSQRTWSQAT